MLLLLCGFISLTSNAQLNVSSGVTPTQLIQSMVGNGLIVSNVVINCDTGAYGTFTNGSTTNLGMNNGILLTTGSAQGVVGANNSSSSASICLGTTTSDPDLVALDPLAIHDVCIVEFDILPSCDSLNIRFVFGSEEYPVYVNSINDLFGFFISGLNPAGGNYTGLNVATLPNGQFVSINNVNNGNTNTGPCVNCAYYIDNTNGTSLQYNGMTVVLSSTVGLVPCTLYHFKIAIADASDCILDSGVFIDLMSCTTAFSTTSQSTPDDCNACNGTATVNVTGGSPPYTYQWLPTGGNAATATNLCTGTYSVLVSDAASCGIPDTIVVNVASNGSIATTSVPVTPTCFGDCNGSLSITPQGGVPPYVYVWTPNVSTTNSASNLCAGTYSVSVSDSSGCTSTNTYVLTQPTQLTLSVTGTDSICAGDSTTLSAATAGGTGPYTVTWDQGLPNGNSQTVSPSTSTTYNATLTDANGCNITTPFTVAITPQPTASFTTGIVTCPPALVDFTNTSVGGFTYSWNFGEPASPNNTSTQQNGSHLYTQPGTYDITLITTTAYGCADTVTLAAAVVILPGANAAVSANTTTVSELTPDVVFTDMSSGGTNCVFYFGDGDSLVGCNFGNVAHSYPSPGTYTAMLVVLNANGCSDTTYITVLVESESTIYIPNAFTPNNSGPNQFFFAYATNVDNFEMLVFDRWGNLLFESHDITKGWDGTYKNELCQEDVYVWRVRYTDSRGKKFKLIGHVSLIR